MRRNKLLIILLFFFTLLHVKGNYQEVPTSIIINKKNNGKIYDLYVSKLDKLYIRLEDMKEVLELPAYMEGGKLLVKYRRKNIKLEYKKYNDIYLIDLDEFVKLPLKKYNWNLNELELSIVTKYQLMDEYLKSKARARESLKSKKEEEEVFEDEWDLITPGFMYINYSTDEVIDNISINYKNNFLYGELDLNYSYYDDQGSLDYFLWSRDINNERLIEVGDTYVKETFGIGDVGNIRGVSLLKRGSAGDYVFTSENEIRGIAPSGTIVELYKNKILSEFQVVKNGEYTFSVDAIKGSNNYEIWIYKLDGTIEKKEVTIYKDDLSLNTGESDYEIQFGEVDEEEYKGNVYSYNYYYGLTNNLTLNLGGFSSYASTYIGEDIERDFNKVRLRYRKSPSKNKVNYVATVEYARDLNEGDYAYQGSIERQGEVVYWSTDYSNLENINNRLNRDAYDESYDFRIGGMVSGVSTRLAYSHDKNKWNTRKREEYSLSLSDSILNNSISISLTGNYLKEKLFESHTKSNYYTMSFGHSFKGRYIKKIFDRISFSTSTEGEGDYRVEVSKNPWGSNFNYSLTAEKLQSEFVYSLNIGIELHDLFNIRYYGRNIENKVHNNYDIITGINLGAKEKIIYKDGRTESSNIYGKVYLDENGNSKYDKNEKGIEGFEIIGDNNIKVLSGKDGKYKLPWVRAGRDSKIEVVSSESDENYYVKPEYLMRLKPGGAYNYNIPVIEVEQLWGTLDFSKEMSLEEVYEVLDNSTIDIIHRELGYTKKVEVKDEFFLVNIPKGVYTLEFKYEGKLEIERYKIIEVAVNGEDNSYETEVIIPIEKVRNDVTIVEGNKNK